ncbi:hypothetical protein Tco_1099083 [Tanacetum coccineum]
MSDKSSPLKRLVIVINVWVKLPEGENIFTLLRILMQGTLFLSTAWRESLMRVIMTESFRSGNTYGIVWNEFLRWVEAETVSPEIEGRNGEDFSYIRCVMSLVYQLMAVKKTSFPETECSGSIVVSIPNVVEGKSEKIGDTSRMVASVSIL